MSRADAALEAEWKSIRGSYKGTVSKDGTVLEGKWEQMGNALPLKLERVLPAGAKPN